MTTHFHCGTVTIADPKQSVYCVKHGHMVPTTEAFADLDGKAFQDYYCKDAVAELTANQK